MMPMTPMPPLLPKRQAHVLVAVGRPASMLLKPTVLAPWETPKA